MVTRRPGLGPRWPCRKNYLWQNIKVNFFFHLWEGGGVVWNLFLSYYWPNLNVPYFQNGMKQTARRTREKIPYGSVRHNFVYFHHIEVGCLLGWMQTCHRTKVFTNLQFSGLIVYCTTKLCHSLDSIIFGKCQIITSFSCSFIHTKEKSDKLWIKLHTQFMCLEVTVFTVTYEYNCSRSIIIIRLWMWNYAIASWLILDINM